MQESASAPSRSRGGEALLVALLVFVACKYVGTANVWKLTHWLFHYELGFVKRGLVGTALRAVLPGDEVSSAAIVVAALLATGLFLVVLGVLAAPLFAGPARVRSLGIGVVALLAPGVGFLLSDLARFDVLNLALTVFVVIATLRLGRFPLALFLGVAALLLLIHEAALLLCLPALLVARLECTGQLEALGSPRAWPGLVLGLAPVFVLFVALAGFGTTGLPLRELLASLAAHADFTPSPRSAYVLLRPLRSNVAQVLGVDDAASEAAPGAALALGSVETLGFWLLLPLALLQQVWAHVAFGALEPGRRRAVRVALHGAFLAPFALLLVGVDWPRWVAGASAQSAVLMLLFARRLPPAAEVVPRGLALASVLVIVLAAGSGLPMQGARRGWVMSPEAGVVTTLAELRAGEPWTRAFVKLPSPREPRPPR